MEQIKKDLIKMGYRELKEGTWAKPVAFHLFLFELDKMLWTNFFKGAEGSILIWNTETYKEKDWEVDGKQSFLMFLKYTEQYTRIDTRNENSEFEFLSIAELISLNL